MNVSLVLAAAFALLAVVAGPLATPIRRARIEVALTAVLMTSVLGLLALAIERIWPVAGDFAALVLQAVVLGLIVELVSKYRRLARLLADPADLQALSGWLRRLDAGRRRSRGYARLVGLRAAEALVESERYDDTIEVLDAVYMRDPERYQGARANVLRALAELGRGDVAGAEQAVLPSEGARHIAVKWSLSSLRALIAALGGDHPRARELLATLPPSRAPSAVSALARAHCLAAEGDDEGARQALSALSPPLRRMALSLARSVPGTATHVASSLETPDVPYR